MIYQSSLAVRIESQKIQSQKDVIPCTPTPVLEGSVDARFEHSNGDVYEGVFDKGAAHGQGRMGFVIVDAWETRCIYIVLPAPNLGRWFFSPSVLQVLLVLFWAFVPWFLQTCRCFFFEMSMFSGFWHVPFMKAIIWVQVGICMGKLMSTTWMSLDEVPFSLCVLTSSSKPSIWYLQHVNMSNDAGSKVETPLGHNVMFVGKFSLMLQAPISRLLALLILEDGTRTLAVEDFRRLICWDAVLLRWFLCEWSVHIILLLYICEYMYISCIYIYT